MTVHGWRRLLACGVAIGLLAASGASVAADRPPARAGTDLPAGALARLADAYVTHESAYGSGTSGAPWNWAEADSLVNFTDAAGNLGVASMNADTHTLDIDTYAPDTYAPVSTRSVSLAGWPVWGGLYAAPDGYLYVFVGRDNPDENDQRDVLAVRRYDQDGELSGTAFVKGGASQVFKGIYEAWGSASMVLVGDRLVVHTARTMYIDEDGVRHQSNFSFEVDTATMTAREFESLDGESPYASHSFNQHVVTVGDDLVFVDHGDAYPRGIQVTTFGGYADGGHIIDAQTEPFTFMGDVGDNYTGSTVTGVVGGPTKLLITGTSVPHGNAIGGVTGYDAGFAQNAYLISQAPSGSGTTFTWLTEFDPNGDVHATEPRLVKISANRFVVLFSVVDGSATRLEYRLLDETGAVLAEASWPATRFGSASQPVLWDTSLVWSDTGPLGDSTERTPTYLYGLDVTDPADPVKLGATASTDAALRTLKTKGAKLAPSFSPGVTSYRATAPKRSGPAWVILRFTAHPGAQITYRVQSGRWVDGTEAQVTVSGRKTRRVEVHVMAEDQTHEQTYTVTVRRARR